MAAVESNGAKTPSRSNSLQRMLDLEKQCKMERLRSHQSGSSRPPSTHSNFNRQSRAYSLSQQQHPVVNTSRSRSCAPPLTITVPSLSGDLHERRSRSPTPKSVSFKHSDTHLSDADSSRSHSSGWESNPEKMRSKRYSVVSERETRDAAKHHPRLTKAPPPNSSRAHAMSERPQPPTATLERSSMVGGESLAAYNATGMTVGDAGRRSNSITSLATLTNRLQLFNDHPKPQDAGFIGGLKLQQERDMMPRTHDFGSSTTPAETGSFWTPTRFSFDKPHPRTSLSSQSPKAGLGDVPGQSTTRTTAPPIKWRDSSATSVPISPPRSSGDKEQSPMFRAVTDLQNDAQRRGHRSTDRLSSSGSQESVSPKLPRYPPSASKTRPGRQERSFSLTGADNGSSNSSGYPDASALQSSRRNSFSSIRSTFTLDEGGFLSTSSGILKGLKEAARTALKGSKHDGDSSSSSGIWKRRSSFVTPVELAASMGAARAVSGEQLPHPPRPPREFMGFEATGWGNKSTPAVVQQHQLSDQSSVSSYEDSSNSPSTYATPSSSRPGSEKGSPTREKAIGSFGQGPPRLSVLGMDKMQAALQRELPGDDAASTSRFVSRPPSLGCLPRLVDGDDGLLRQEEPSQSPDIDQFVEETWSRSAMNVALAESLAATRSTEGFKLESPLATLSAQSLVPPPLEIHASAVTATSARGAVPHKRELSSQKSGELGRVFAGSSGSAPPSRPGSSESGSGGPIPVLPPRKRGHTADASIRRSENPFAAPPTRHQHQSSGAMSAGPALYLETARQLAPAAPPPRSLRRPQPVGPSKTAAATVSTAYGRETRLAPGTAPMTKTLVRCCRCEFLHDMPPRLRECLERPDGRVPDRRAGSGAAVSGAVTTVVKCPWCGHGMATGCCAGFVADVFLRERLH